MFRINELGARKFSKSFQSVKVIAADRINKARRLCLGGVLLWVLFSKKVQFYWKMKFLESFLDFYSYELPTLRVGRSVFRLKVYWAFVLSTGKESSDFR